MPQHMAVVLTYPERVTRHNMDKLRLRVLNGEAKGDEGPRGAWGGLSNGGTGGPCGLARATTLSAWDTAQGVRVTRCNML